jgi:hypothetical protein
MVNILDGEIELELMMRSGPTVFGTSVSKDAYTSDTS